MIIIFITAPQSVLSRLPERPRLSGCLRCMGGKGSRSFGTMVHLDIVSSVELMLPHNRAHFLSD